MGARTIRPAVGPSTAQSTTGNWGSIPRRTRDISSLHSVFVRDTCPTQSLLSAHWGFVPEDKVAEAVTLVPTDTKVPS